jgi:hypothetical protein
MVSIRRGCGFRGVRMWDARFSECCVGAYQRSCFTFGRRWRRCARGGACAGVLREGGKHAGARMDAWCDAVVRGEERCLTSITGFVILEWGDCLGDGSLEMQERLWMDES